MTINRKYFASQLNFRVPISIEIRIISENIQMRIRLCLHSSVYIGQYKTLVMQASQRIKSRETKVHSVRRAAPIVKLVAEELQPLLGELQQETVNTEP